MNRTRVVVSGLGWMGSGVGAVETAIRELFQGARQEILITAYSIGNAGDFFDLLEDALARGVAVRMIVNRVKGQHVTSQDKLAALLKIYPHFQLFDFDRGSELADLHAKTIVVDRKRALVGSSNLSRNGLRENHELGVVLEGKEVSDIASALDSLAYGTFCVKV